MTRILIFTALAYSLCGCKTVAPFARLPGGHDIALNGPLREVFAAVTAHDAAAITISERTTIYGNAGDVPSERLQCHENQHKEQARGIAEALIALGALEDTAEARMAAWLAVYGQAYLRHGYDNDFERRAREMCK